MAGQPGKSGGARAGAGRKKKEPPILTLAATYDDPAKFLRAVMNDSGSEAKLRVDAAKALMPFVHQKLGEGGKKQQQDDAAKKVAGRFAAGTPPKLVATGGKKV